MDSQKSVEREYARMFRSAQTVEEALRMMNDVEAISFMPFFKIGDQGFKRVLKALPMGNIKALAAWNHSISTLNFLGDILQNNTSLCYLGLRGNPINDRSIKELVPGIQNNASLTYLDLRGTQIGDGGADMLAKVLDKNLTLKYVILESTRASEEAKENIQRKLERNRNIITKYKSMAKLEFQRLLKSSKSTLVWGESRVMVLGQAKAGKTQLVRSLTRQKFQHFWDPTSGIKLTKEYAHMWKKVNKRISHDFTALAASKTASLHAVHRHARAMHCLYEGLDASSQQEEDINSKNDDVEHDSASEFFSINNRFHDEYISGDVELVSQGLREDAASFMDDSEINRRYNGEYFQKIGTSGDTFPFTIWDFAGQSIYYHLHHLFLNDQGVCILVFSMRDALLRRDETVQYLVFWLRSLRFYSPRVPVFLVGTFLDDKPVEKNLRYINGTVQIALNTSVFTDFVPNQKESFCFFPVSNISKKGIVHLRSEISTCSTFQESKLCKVPIRWTRCLDLLLDTKEPWICIANVKEIARTLQITSAIEVEEMLTFFEHLKIVIFLNSSANLRDTVILDVQWLIDSICIFMRDPNDGPLKLEDAQRAGLEDDVIELYEKGLLSYDLVDHCWHPSQIPFLIDFMRAVFLLSDWKYEERKFLLPSVIPNEDQSDQAVYANTFFEEEGSSCKIQFASQFIPFGLFQRFLCLCVAYNSSIAESELPKLFMNYCVLSFGSKAKVCIRKENNGIRMNFVNDVDVARRFRIFLSLLKRLVHNFKGPLSFSIMVEKQGNWIHYKDAKKEKLKPWFVDSKSSENLVDFNITEFLSAL